MTSFQPPRWADETGEEYITRTTDDRLLAAEVSLDPRIETMARWQFDAEYAGWTSTRRQVLWDTKTSGRYRLWARVMLRVHDAVDPLRGGQPPRANPIQAFLRGDDE